MNNHARLAPLIALLCAFAAAGAARGDAGTYRVDPDRTSARFAVHYLGLARAEGRFGRTAGTIVLDEQQRVDSIELVIDTRSVDMGWDLRDAFVRSEAMFDSERFPQLHFRSTRASYDGARLVGIDGELTLRGVTRPVRLEVERVECAPRSGDGQEACAAAATGRLSRRAFGMDFAYPLIGEDVELDFALTAVRVRAAGEAKIP